MMNENGCAVCENGQERYEEFYSKIARKRLVQYDYRTPDGRLFSCVRKTVEACRESRDRWLELEIAKSVRVPCNDVVCILGAECPHKSCPRHP